MKKILIIGMSCTLGGVETYIYNLIKNIEHTKYYIDFLIIGRDETSVFENEIEGILHDGKSHFFYTPNLKKAPIKTIRWLYDFYRNKKYDVIYLNTCTAARIMYCIFGINLNAKLITHSHNGQADDIIGKFNNRIFKRYTTKKSVVKLACSDIAYHYLFSDLPTGKWFLPNGVDTKRFSFNEKNRIKIREELQIDNDWRVIGCVGRFTDQKNHKYLIDIAENLNPKHIFLLIGDGKKKQEIKDMINLRGIRDKFLILDSQNDIERYYSAMDAFIMPSIFEGLPITAVEAQCNGLPCIFSDTITRQVSLSNNCYFLPLSDKMAWIRTLYEVTGNRYEGKKVIEKAGFDVESSALVISELFDRI